MKTVAASALVWLVMAFNGCARNQASEVASSPLIGREIADFDEIDRDMVVGSFAAVPRYTDSEYVVSIIGRKGVDSLKCIMFTKRVARGSSTKAVILDTLLINSNQYPNKQLDMGGCTFNGAVSGALVFAIYDRYALSGNNAPAAAWNADTLKRAFVPIDPAMLSCESGADVIDEP